MLLYVEAPGGQCRSTRGLMALIGTSICRRYLLRWT